MSSDEIYDWEELPGAISATEYADIQRLLELSMEAAIRLGDSLLRMEIEGLCEKVSRIVDAIA